MNSTPHLRSFVVGLLHETEVSHLRGIPVTMKGTIIGRGIPGFFLSKDRVLQDETGYITLIYHQPLRLLESLFGLFKSKKMNGHEVTAYGWYRLAPGPMLELRQVVDQDGNALHCQHIVAQKVLAGLVLVIGIAIVLLV